MFCHVHPYRPFLFKDTTRLIVGTLPPPRFSTGLLRPSDVDFCYGSDKGLLWKALDKIYGLNLTYRHCEKAIQERKAFLQREKIGICDMVSLAFREKIDASDLGMQRIVVRDILSYLKVYSRVETLIFTGGNTKNGPEYLFRKLLRQYDLPLLTVQNYTPKRHRFDWMGRRLETISLTAPSGSANRAIGQMEAYKAAKRENPNFTAFDFRVQQYKAVFKGELIE